MRDKCLKGMLEIFLILMLIVFPSTTFAAVAYDGQTHYGAGDLSWTGTKIYCAGSYYWCANKGAELGRNLLDLSKISTAATVSPGDLGNDTTLFGPLSFTAANIASGNLPGAYRTQFINKAITYLNNNLANNKTATISWGSWGGARNVVEAAIYGFANHFGCSEADIANSIWLYENTYQGSGNAGAWNSLWEAALGFRDWANASNIGSGHYRTGHDTGLNINTTNTKISIISNQDKYVVGPIQIQYNAGGIYGNIRFVKDVNISVTDQRGNPINCRKVDAEGNVYTEFTNGQQIFLEFDYTHDITAINIHASLSYISEVWGECKTDISRIHTWTYSVSNASANCSYSMSYAHQTTCTSDDQFVLSRTEAGWNAKHCDYCNMITQYYMNGTVSATVVPTGTVYTGQMQNLRSFNGNVSWSTKTASASINIPTDGMDIAGYVWEDGRMGKDSVFNGSLDDEEKYGTEANNRTDKTVLKGIEVRLYTEDGELAEVRNTNPTLTDENGHYQFIGISPIERYYVKFTYDGMIYINTYGAGQPEYNTDAWNRSSKGTEIVRDRNHLNEVFVSVGAYPTKYKVETVLFESIEYLQSSGENYYNLIFNENEIEEYQLKITERLEEYLEEHNRLEDGTQEYIDAIYAPILSQITDEQESIRAARILQYIWDCRIDSYAGYESLKDGKLLTNDELYPYQNKALLKNPDGTKYVDDDGDDMYGYYPIYNGQLHVNQGVVRRNYTDLELLEDVYQAVVSINQTDEVYTYNTLQNKEIGLLSSHAKNYTHNIANSDYNYATSATQLDIEALENLDGLAVYTENGEKYAPIEVYVTYKIKVTNKSLVPTSVKEVATYFDTTYYSYSDRYTTTTGREILGIEGKHTYIETNQEGVPEEREKNLTEYETDENHLEIYLNTSSQYGATTGQQLGKTEIYISFSKDIILESNEGLALYITYRLGEDSTSHPEEYSCTYNEDRDLENANAAYRILQDLLPEDNPEAKIELRTISEVAAFATYFSKSVDETEVQDKYKEIYNCISYIRPHEPYRAAGVLDIDSTPGNLTLEQVEEERAISESNAEIEDVNQRAGIEDDWDDASAFTISRADNRKLRGTVWETVRRDLEEYTANYWAKDGSDYPIYSQYSDEDKLKYAIEGMTVELIELKEDNELLRARTTTKLREGKIEYEFKGYIPGRYIVKFTYGEKVHYDETPENLEDEEKDIHISSETKFRINDTQEIDSAYNGLLYQSAKANPYTNDVQYWYHGQEGIRYSDAVDDGNRRVELNETLQNYTYVNLIETVKDFSQNNEKYLCYAYTSMLDICVELATTSRDYNLDGESNPGYSIDNVDFGLTPRAPTKLEIDKEVTHVKMILSNGIVQFDADTSTIREQGVPGVQQAAPDIVNGIRYDINIAMSSELVSGATIEITYTITVRNASVPVTTDIYRETADSEEALAVGMYNETMQQLVYYKGEVDDLARSHKEEIESESKALVVADFIPKNIEFIKNDYAGKIVNEDWNLYNSSTTTLGIVRNEDGDIVSQEELDFDYYGIKEALEKAYYTQNTAAEELAKKPEIHDMDPLEIYESDDIVIANENNPLITTSLKPDEKVSTELVLSKVMSVNDEKDKKVYENKARILKIHSSDSRIQAMPFKESERLIVSDPTGSTDRYLITGLILVVSLIIATGIVLIKKFVLTNK